MVTWGILSLNDLCSASLELCGSSPRHSSSAWTLRGWQGVSGWLPSLLPAAVRVVMHFCPEALMHSSGTSHVPRVKAAAAGSAHLPHFPPFSGVSAWTRQCSLFNISVVHQRLCRKQTNGIVLWHHVVLDMVLQQCCSCTASRQSSMPNPNSCSLPIRPSDFLSPLSEFSCSDMFYPAIPWPRSWLFCFQHRWLQAAVGRSPGSGDPPCFGGGPTLGDSRCQRQSAILSLLFCYTMD